jgi:FkbM family methyltransferase
MTWGAGSGLRAGRITVHSIFAEVEDSLKRGILRTFGKVRQWVLGPHAVAVLARTENGLLLAPAGDVMVGRRLCFNGCYDPELLDFLLERCESASSVLFVGAHVGALAIPTAKKVREVVAVEANPTTAHLLRMNVMLNGLQNVEIRSFAAGDRNAEVSFLARRLNSGASMVEMGEWHRKALDRGKPERITVQMKRLDNVFSDAYFDLIVMDIEGAEALALRGMPNLLMRCRGLLVEVFETPLKHVAKVSDEDFLSRVAPFFDEAVILTEKPRGKVPVSSAPYPRSAFREMMQECSRLRKTNVMFWKGQTSQAR